MTFPALVPHERVCELSDRACFLVHNGGAGEVCMDPCQLMKEGS